MKKLFNYLLNPRDLLLAVMVKTASLWGDVTYLRIMHFLNTGSFLHLKNPQTYSEKCQWMKLYYQKPELSTMVDKYEVKQYVADRIGKEHVVECYGVWNHFDEIDFDKLPNQFVLKCTHNSGAFVICKDKAIFDKATAKEEMENALANNYYLEGREWVYKNVQPRILAEKYMDSLGKPDSVEYKITCMEGTVSFVTVCGGIAHAAYEQRSNNHYTKDWQPMPWYARYKPLDKKFEKTSDIEKMIEYSEKLSQGIPQVRVDWYIHKGQIYFGEFTFYTWSGWPHFTPKEWDRKLGEKFPIPAIKFIEDSNK